MELLDLGPLLLNYYNVLLILLCLFVLNVAIVLFVKRKVFDVGTKVIYPGFQCNRFSATFVALRYMWSNRAIYNEVACLGAFGAAKLFYKEGFFRVWLFHRPMIAVVNPEVAKSFLSNNISFNKKAPQYNFLSPWLREGLLLSTGQKWKTRRRLLTPAFHFNILESFISAMNSTSKQFSRIIKDHYIDCMVNYNSLISKCTLDALCDSIMGIHLNSLGDEECQYITNMIVLEKSMMKRFFNPFLMPDFIFYLTPFGRRYKKSLKFVRDFNLKVIRNRKSDILSDSSLCEQMETSFQNQTMKFKRPFLDLLLSHHIFLNDLSEDDIEEEVSTFMFEGHDTTAVGITGSLFLLGNNPKVQSRLQEEIDSVLGEDINRNITINDIKELHYLDLVVKECLRVCPPVPFIGRITEDIIKIGKNGKYEIPKGTPVGIMIPALHWNPDSYENPFTFDPDHFLPEKCAKRHPYAYVPFSAGQRNCIGQRFAIMEIKVFLATMLQQFSIVSSCRFEELRFRSDVVLRTTPGMTFKFIPRK